MKFHSIQEFILLQTSSVNSAFKYKQRLFAFSQLYYEVLKCKLLVVPVTFELWIVQNVLPEMFLKDKRIIFSSKNKIFRKFEKNDCGFVIKCIIFLLSPTSLLNICKVYFVPILKSHMQKPHTAQMQRCRNWMICYNY